MVLKQMRASYPNGHEGHVFKLSAADVLVVTELNISAVAIRCSAVRVSIVEASRKGFAFCIADKLRNNSPYSTPYRA